MRLNYLVSRIGAKVSLLKLALPALVFFLPATALADNPPEFSPYYTQHNYHLLPSGEGFGINESDGSFKYDQPIDIPPGRNGMQPGLNLSYNSNDRQSLLFGYGWSLSIPFIQRINKTGTEDLYSQDYFFSTLSGELASTTGNFYGAKVDTGDFLRYEFVNNTWTIIDKKGITYKFGISSSARQYDPNDSSHVYTWYLEEMVDPNGNAVNYTYEKDQGAVYPDIINYTRNGASAGVFDIAFFRETRDDIATSTASGFPIVTKQRISEIQAKINGSWVKKYEINYTTGVNGNRSLISDIVATGKDESGNTIALPATTFDYEDKAGAYVLDSLTDLSNIPYFNHYSVGGDLTELGTKIFDVNADGLDDIVVSSAFDGNPNGDAVLINQGIGDGWVGDENYSVPVPFYGFYSGTVAGTDLGVRPMDVNGDGYIDLVQAYQDNGSTPKGVYINNADGTGWTQASYTVPDIVFSSRSYAEQGARVIEANGDGLPDILQSYFKDTSGADTLLKRLFINNGSNGWTEDTSVNTSTLPVFFVETDTTIHTFVDQGLQVADVNADGLDDLIHGLSFNTASDPNLADDVYINQGNSNGWAHDPTYTVPVAFYDHYSNPGLNGEERGKRLADLDDDGNIDISGIMNRGDGTGWGNTPQGGYGSPLPFYKGGTALYEGVYYIDANGDNLPDIIQSFKNGNSPTTHKLYFSEGKRPDVLKKIELSEGGSISTSYKNSSNYFDGSGNSLNPDFPLKLNTVSAITKNDGFGTVATTTYEYAGGFYYYNTVVDRKLAGFGRVTKTDPDGNVTKTYYHQGNASASSTGEFSDHISKAGKMYREEVYDDSGNLHSKTVNKWENYGLGNDRNFVKLTESVNFAYDGDADHRDIAQGYLYDDSNGNVTQKNEWGEVTGSDNGTYSDTGSDKFTTTLSYISTSTPYLAGLPKQETIENQSATKVKETKYYYDNLSHGSAQKGNETKRELWEAGTTYIDTEKSYNSLGLVTQEKDPRDKVTAYGYDSKNLYPQTVTNPLSQVTSYYYDYSSGKVASSTDPNGFVHESIYDALDRNKIEKQPDVNTPSTLVDRTIFIYTDTKGAKKVQQTNYLNAATSTDAFAYFDGFNRIIQERKEAEEASAYAITDTQYNNRDLVESVSLPYFSSGSSRTSPTTTADLLTLFTYDPLKRITEEQNIVGSTVHGFDQWKETITDAENNQKHFYRDAYLNLARVDEQNATSTYTTLYEYDYNRKLTKLTDALGNIRNFTYDGLGHRRTAEDLHASTDATYGSWTYSYDDAGNLTQSVDPLSQTVAYTHDDINRVTSENFTGAAGTELSYAYDSCSNGIGKLCSATSADIATQYTYNGLGVVKKETRTIDYVAHETLTDYDRQSNVIHMKYPDDSDVLYSYNDAGLLESIALKEPGDIAYSDLVVDINYAPTGQIAYEEYANGVTTTNTYDPDEMYHLRHKLTIAGGGMGMALMQSGSENNFSQAITSALSESAETLAGPASLDRTFDVSRGSLYDKYVADSEIQKDYFLYNSVLLHEPVDSEDIVITLGEKNATEFEPKLEISRWDGEARFSIAPDISATAKQERSVVFDGDTIKYGVPGKEYHLYSIEPSDEHQDGAYEFEVVIPTKPESNMFRFNIESEGLEFYYQSPLNEEEHDADVASCTETRCFDKNGTVVIERPENIIRSYAVYNSTKQGDFSKVGGKNYRTGKAFHIYRPQAIDASGKQSWGDLAYTYGTLTVIIPQEFLDSAVYPITVDPTFGYGTAGASSIVWNGDTAGINKHSLSVDGQVSKLSFYGKALSGTKNVKALIYDDDAPSAEPLTQVGVGSATTVNTTLEWKDMTFSSPISLLAGNWWLGLTNDNDYVQRYYDSVTPNTPERRINSTSGTYNSPPNQWPYATDGAAVRENSIYATYDSNPTEPSSLLTEGAENPTGVTDINPEFSAIYNDPDAGDQAIFYQLQVSTSSSQWTGLKWDSGKTSMATTTAGTRSPDISYGGTALSTQGSTYYWRIKFWDDDDAVGDWSTSTALFTTADLPYEFIPTIQDLTYTYDTVGNITRIADASETDTNKQTDYGYDDLYRLLTASTTNAISSNYKVDHSYDAIGDMTYQTGQGTYLYQGDQGSSYANPHAVTSINGTPHTYDRNGNLLSNGVWNYIWNYKNQLSQAGTSTATSTYAYDHTGQRVKALEGGVGGPVTTYVNKFFNKKSDKVTKHIYAGDTLVATIEKTGVANQNIQNNGGSFASTGSGPAWTTPANAQSSNNVWTRVDVSNQNSVSQSLQASNFGFSIPSSATIKGIYVEVEHSTSLAIPGAAAYDDTVSLLGLTASANKALPALWSTTDQYVGYGGTIDTWSTTDATPATINSSSFGVQVRVHIYDNGCEEYYSCAIRARVDHIRIKVYYTTFDGVDTYAVHSDHLGGTNALTDEQGNTTEVIDYYPFGDIRLDTQYGTVNEKRKFTGHEYDSNTGLTYMGARYYPAPVARFLSQDPVFLALGDKKKTEEMIKMTQEKILADPQSLNTGRTMGGLNSTFASGWSGNTQSRGNSISQFEYLADPQAQNSYAYARGNPITMKDPEGLWGVFFQGSLSAEAGLLSGFAANASVGRGFVAGGPITSPRVETGSYGSYGGLVGGFILGTTIEGSKGTDVNSMVAGVNVGPSGGIMFTNATKLDQLSGVTRNSWSMSLGIGAFQWSKSENGIWTFSAGLGKPGLSISSYPTNTKVAPDKKDNKK